MNAKKEMTIEEMIAAGTPWDQIKARIEELQAEQKRKEKLAAEKAAKEKQRETAKDRFITALIDWMVMENVISLSEAPAIKKIAEMTCDSMVKDLKRMKIYRY
jgi:negative regulator of genetic competence, sporulation and motility